jgi:hypothetical protein
MKRVASDQIVPAKTRPERSPKTSHWPFGGWRAISLLEKHLGLPYPPNARGRVFICQPFQPQRGRLGRQNGEK